MPEVHKHQKGKNLLSILSREIRGTVDANKRHIRGWKGYGENFNS